MPRPATGKTPVRNVRVGDEIWEQVERAADEDDTTASAIVKEALLEYVAKRAKQRARKARERAAREADPSS
ncbi:hypothetical protein ACFOY2_05045 [Nonomuraea purpurea]|uniref:Ribbon-helix-helix protein, CopG family n=1 Tax=Nonomuraea purpurea TaxID=1849276 RepID=A0ABV8FXW7_9ACTN